METFLRNRPHLQSASYHTLSRIFSCSINLSVQSPIPNLDASINKSDDKIQTENTIEDTSKSQNFDLGEKDEIFQLVEESLQEENGNVHFNNSVKLDDIISDLSLLIGDKIVGFNEPIISGDIVDNNELDLGNEEIVSSSNLDQLTELEVSKDISLEVENYCIGEIKCGNDQIVGLNEPIINEQIVDNNELDLGKEEVVSSLKLDQLIDENMEDESNCIAEINCGNDQIVGLPIINAQILDNNELDLGKEEIISSSKLDNENTKDESNLQKLNNDSNVGDFEEGEISDDVQDLDVDIETEDKDESLIKINSEFNNKEEYNYQGLIHNIDMENDRDELISDDEKLHEEGVKAEEKKRKRVLTEERKAKKKKAKRIKRAKKLREEGVKRLRVPLTIKKEKEKIICKFFLNGKCQQGDKCKFSHDATPLTKSKPCNHFARGECLKGEECPYDHNLSKYPCHKFISEGMCIRGPNCKFSHTIQAKEATILSEKSKSNPAKENTSTRENISSAKTSPVAKSVERPAKVPKGIKILSFKKDPAVEKTGKQNDESGLLGEERTRISNDGFGSLSNLKGERLRNEVACGEVSEASKILQEFLFSALSPY